MSPPRQRLDPRRRAILEDLPRKLRIELERALTLDGDAARRARALDESEVGQSTTTCLPTP